MEFLSTITFITTSYNTEYYRITEKNDREFGKGIEAHPAPDMSKQLEDLQLAHTEREKAGQFTHLPQSTRKAL